MYFDYAAEHLKLPYLSAYLNSIGANFRHGANFATGGSTIRRQNETIFEYGISPFSLDIQIAQFEQFKARTYDLYQQGYFIDFPVQYKQKSFNLYSFFKIIMQNFFPSPAKKPSDTISLPRPEEFSKALYTFDIGQNDLSVGFRKLSVDQLRAALPDIVNQLASAVQVSRSRIPL